MAHAISNAAVAGNPIKDVFAAIGQFFVMISESNRRVQKMEQLSALSDEELAARGLRREDIAREVFKDVFFL